MKRSRGLTLIEVLVASVILFSALGLVATVFQYNLHSQSRLLRQLEQIENFASLKAQIHYSLSKGERQGTVSLGDVELSWQATAIRAAAPITSYDFENDREVATAEQMLLLQVDLVFSGSERQLSYKEALWQNKQG
ncbi:MAG: type II secretion system protein [Alishewanella aestuarii]